MAKLLTPSQIAQNYRSYLSGLQPNLNVDQEDSDWYIRSRVIGGVVAGVYADNLLISNDAFPQSARRDALASHLQTLFGPDPVLGNFLPATQSQGVVAVTGSPGQLLSAGLQANYTPNGNAYVVQTNTTLDAIAGTGLVPFQSVASGQDQNLNSGAILTFPSPPSGLNSRAVVASGGLSDATDAETTQAAAARILKRLRQPLSVGRVGDYEQYATEASASVTSVSVVKEIFGPGTVGVYITSGTTDIDTAINNGDTISLIPSDQLIATVLNFLRINGVLTDAIYVLAPTLKPVNVTVQVTYSNGDGSTIPSNQTLTQQQLVAREVKRAIYKTPVGGRKIGTSGFVFASDIEQTMDIGLSGEPFESGAQQLLADRQVSGLSATGANLSLAPNEIPVPGTITVLTV